jgi:hypothetical protein
MARRATSARVGGPLIGVALSLAAGVGCSAYDPHLLSAAPSNGPVDSGHVAMQMDARVGGGPARFDAATAGDAAARRDAAPAPFDAGADDMLDSGVEVMIDAGCLGEGNPEGGDCCPNDESKTDPGVCGCGMPDADSDGDGALDCMEACPHDGQKREPGACGCGVPDTDTQDAASCDGIESQLAHRYRFNGSGSAITDSVGNASGTFVHAALTGTGAAVLAGGTTDQYIDLPNKIVSDLTNATFEAWLTWNGGAAWQRIFDFGDATSRDEDEQESGRSYLFLTAASGADATGTVRAAYKRSTLGADEIAVNAAMPLAVGTMAHVAVVFDDSNNRLTLYVNGALAMSTAISNALSSINDVNNWIGRSQFSNDAELNATVHEFRIYKAALSAKQIRSSFVAGPDPIFLED